MNELFRWENLIFLGPLIVGGVMYLALSLIGDIGHDGHAEVDVHPGAADIHHGHDTDINSDHSPSWSLLDLLGIGKAPLGVIGLTLCAIWSLAGFVSLQIFGYHMVMLCIAIAALAALSITGVIARKIGGLVPAHESYAQSGLQFWGATGVVRYTIRSDAGTVQVRDRYGNTIDLECRLTSGQEEIPPHAQVTIDDYDEASCTYRVVRNDLGEGVSTQQHTT